MTYKINLGFRVRLITVFPNKVFLQTAECALALSALQHGVEAVIEIDIHGGRGMERPMGRSLYARTLATRLSKAIVLALSGRNCLNSYPSDRVSDDLPPEKCFRFDCINYRIPRAIPRIIPAILQSDRAVGIASGSTSCQAQVNPSIAGPVAVCSNMSRAMIVPSLQYPFRPPHARVLSCLSEIAFRIPLVWECHAAGTSKYNLGAILPLLTAHNSSS